MIVNRTIAKIFFFQQAGKNWGSLRGKIFARLLRAESAAGVGKRFRNSCASRKAKQKNFRFLN